MLIGIDASRANQREKTGTEWYAWHLIRALAQQMPTHRIRLYLREPLRSDWGTLGPHVEVRVLHWRPGLLWSHLRLGWELLWHPPELLFVPADTVPLIRRTPTCTTIHDIAFERHPDLYSQRSVQRRLGWLRPFIHVLVRMVTGGRYGASEVDYHRWSVRHAIRVSRIILTVSEYTKRELVDILRVQPDRIIVTYQGVAQPKQFDTINPASREQVLLKYQLQRPYFLYVGRLERKKNIEALLTGYRRYVSTEPNPCDLVLVGSPGFGWDQMKNILLDPQMKNHVHQLGWLPEHDAQVLRSSARVFCYLSVYEGFGVPPLESLSAGVPVLASQGGSIPEILGEAGWYVNPANPDEVATGLRRLANDSTLSKRLVTSGQHRVRQFTWKRTAEITIQAFQAVLQKSH